MQSGNISMGQRIAQMAGFIAGLAGGTQKANEKKHTEKQKRAALDAVSKSRGQRKATGMDQGIKPVTKSKRA